MVILELLASPANKIERFRLLASPALHLNTNSTIRGKSSVAKTVLSIVREVADCANNRIDEIYPFPLV